MADSYAGSQRLGVAGGRSFLVNLALSLRPKQWTKNAFVFAGIVFSQNLFDSALLWRVIQLFALFSLLSGGLYLINDVTDLEEDRRHPLKRYRPVAAGAFPVPYAIGAAFILIAGSLAWAFMLDPWAGVICLAYALQVAVYSLYLKQHVLVDVFLIALGFVLRVLAGAAVIRVTVSSWLLISATLLALFLALSKRRGELAALERAQEFRSNLADYSLSLLDQMISIVASAMLVVYTIYTFLAARNSFLMLTIPFVLFGVFRYLYLIHRQDAGSEPEQLVLADRPLATSVVLWVAACLLILYGI